jgi:cell division protein FtsB
MNKTDTFEKRMKQINKIPLWIKQQRQINTLENKVEVLENSIKDELYKEFMKKLGEPLENERLRKENKRLRQQVKSLKEVIKEGK